MLASKRFLSGSVAFVGLTFASVGPLSAAEYFVHAGVGSNGNSGLSPEQAFADLDHATRQLRPGDTLWLREGEYSKLPIISSRFHLSGTETSPITLKPYPAEVAIIRSSSKLVIQDLSWWAFEGFVFSSAPFKLGMDDTALPEDRRCTSFAERISFRGIRFQHSSRAAIELRCARHIRIEENLLDNLRSRVAGSDLNAIALQQQTDDIVISGNHFRDIGSDGIQIEGRPGGQHTNVFIVDNDFEVQRPYRYRDETGQELPPDQWPFDGVGENGVDIKRGPGPIWIEGNSFHGFAPAPPGQDASGGGAGAAAHMYARGIRISRNNFFDNQVHLAIGQGATSQEYPDRDVEVSYNIFDETDVVADFEGLSRIGIMLVGVSNVRVFHNSIRNQLHDVPTLLFVNKLRSVELHNNVFSGGRVRVLSDGDMDLHADYNAWSSVVDAAAEPAPLTEPLAGPHDIVADNLLIDWQSMTPLEGSPTVDAASYLGAAVDYYGKGVSGAAPDMGAVELQRGAPAVPGRLRVR